MVKNILSELALVAITLSSPAFLFSQGKETKWYVKDPFYDKVFIENNGQYPNETGNVVAGTQNDDFSVFFGPKGYCIKETITKNKFNYKEEREENEDGKGFKMNTIEQRIYALFVDRSDRLQIKLECKVPSTYGFLEPDPGSTGTINNISAYKKIVYENLYDNINAEFYFDDEKAGLKYNYIIQPGANTADIQIKYPGADKIFIDIDGNLHILLAEAEIVDKAPAASCNGKAIPVVYRLDGDIIRFSVGVYDHSEVLVIDPFVTNPAFTTINRAFDIAKDGAGNIYVYGGRAPVKLKKFSSTGALIWTYTTTYNQWHGDLAVDLAGNSFISEGCCGGGLMKISTTNTVLFNQNYGVHEFWCLSFNCDYTKLYLAQGYAASATTFVYNSISNVNLTTGAVTGGVAVVASEPRALAWGPNKNMYILSCTSGTSPNRTVGVTPAFANIFDIPSGYILAYNGPSYANMITSGQNGIAAGKNFYCTSDGLTLMKRNLITGALIAQISIPGGVKEANSGILIDDCDNIYAGSSNAIYKYDAAMSLITSTPTSGAVYCLSEGTNGEVLACGNGFIGSYDLTYSQLFLTTAISSTPAGCSCSGAANVSATGGCTTFSYNWSNGSTAQTISNLCPGVYTVTISTWCPYRTLTVSITGSGSGLSLTTNSINGTCSVPGSISATPSNGTGPYTYSWSPGGQTGQTATGLTSGNYTVIVTDATGCSATATTTIISPPALAVQFIKGTAICAGCGCKQWIMVNATGGTSPYSYSWPDGSDKRYKNQLCPGTYTVNIKDKNGCSVNVSLTVP